MTVADIWALFVPQTPDFSQVDLYARFILSGYVILTIRNIYISTDRANLGEIAVDVFLLSLINQMVWLALVQLAKLLQLFAISASPEPEHFAGNPFGPSFLLFLETVGLPVCLGILFGYALRNGAGENLARRLAMPVIGPTPRAYDHVFSQRGPCFMILSFEGGRTVYGYYGASSRAGRDAGRSEIFLERLYALDDDGNWIETIPPRSALINLAGLRAIEFIEET